MSSKSLLRKLSFSRYEHNDQFEPEILNPTFVEFNSDVFLKVDLATRLGTDNLEICFIRQTLKILFSNSGNKKINQ